MVYLLSSIVNEKLRVRCHYVKNIEYQLVVGSNEYIAAASLLDFHGNNIEESDKIRHSYKHRI